MDLSVHSQDQPAKLYGTMGILGFVNPSWPTSTKGLPGSAAWKNSKAKKRCLRRERKKIPNLSSGATLRSLWWVTTAHSLQAAKCSNFCTNVVAVLHWPTRDCVGVPVLGETVHMSCLLAQETDLSLVLAQWETLTWCYWEQHWDEQRKVCILHTHFLSEHGTQTDS